MAKRDPRMIPIGYGKFVRADRVYALVPIEGGQRGDGRRTYVHVDGLAEPVVASRSERAILADVDNTMRVAQEEIFGPVLSFIPYDGDDQAAVRMANDSRYGLAGGVWTGDPARGLEVAKRIRSGVVHVNRSRSPFPLTPFGGLKESGMGRELGPEGLANFLEPRTISVPPSLLEAAARPQP